MVVSLASAAMVAPVEAGVKKSSTRKMLATLLASLGLAVGTIATASSASAYYAGHHHHHYYSVYRGVAVGGGVEYNYVLPGYDSAYTPYTYLSYAPLALLNYSALTVLTSSASYPLTYPTVRVYYRHHHHHAGY